MRDILRKHTKKLHEELDKAFITIDLQNQNDYEKFLNIHAWAIIPLEKKLRESENFLLIPSAEKRLRSQTIKNDLAQLGLSLPQTSLPTMSYINAVSEIAGIMYVLEGSRLGAKVLVKQIKQVPQLPTSFLNHGKDENYWSSYISWLNNHTWSNEDQDKAMIAAQSVFKLYLQAVEKFMTPEKAY